MDGLRAGWRDGQRGGAKGSDDSIPPTTVINRHSLLITPFSHSLRSSWNHVHNIDVIWHHCEAPGGCQYNAKDRGILRTHMRNVHELKLGNSRETLYLKGGSGPGRSMKTKSKNVVDVPVMKKDPSPNDVRIRIRYGNVVLDEATGGVDKGVDQGRARMLHRKADTDALS